MFKMLDSLSQHSTAVGTAGGTIVTVAFTHQQDILKTIILAAVGATVSFFVSYGLKILLKWIKK
jgi:hypothetical protein